MLYIWLFCFSILHFISTLDWSSYDALLWEASLWTHLTALLVVNESAQLIQLAPSNGQAFFDECNKRKISCFKGDANESLPFEINTADKIQNHIHQSILNTFKTESKLQTWAWSDIWYSLPHARTNTYVIHFKTPQAQYLLVDTESLKKPTQNNLFYFSAMTSLGVIVWIVFGGLVMGFHLFKWKTKRKALRT
jgi:hypothetical protein